MISGGYHNGDLNQTEVYNVIDDDFSNYVPLPKTMVYHNLVNVNNTHMVALGGDDYSDEVFIYDRYFLFNSFYLFKPNTALKK